MRRSVEGGWKRAAKYLAGRLSYRLSGLDGGKEREFLPIRIRYCWPIDFPSSIGNGLCAEVGADTWQLANSVRMRVKIYHYEWFLHVSWAYLMFEGQTCSLRRAFTT
jgi:hypothetical protein